MDELYVVIQDAANKIATPNWAARWSVYITAITGGIAFITMLVTITISRRQIKIAKQQNSIALEQAKFSKLQAEITEKQNKIALFEKRYEVYSIIEKCKNIAEILEKFPITNEQFIQKLLSTFIDNSSGVSNTQADIALALTNISFKLCQGTFLFSENIGMHTNRLAKSLANLYIVTAGVPEYQLNELSIKKYINVVKDLIDQKIPEEIRKMLYLQSSILQ